MKKSIKSMLCVSIASVLVACGSGSGSGGDDSSRGSSTDSSWPPAHASAVASAYGNVVDSPIEGLRYVSGNHYGVTDSTGKFGYIDGQMVTFYVGDIVLGQVTPQPLLTPTELANYDSRVAINIARFLQTVDNDADPANGIQIGEAVHFMAENRTLLFDGESWGEDAQTKSLILDLTSATEAGTRSLVTEAVAFDHLRMTYDKIIDDLELKVLEVAERSVCTTHSDCIVSGLRSKFFDRCGRRGTSFAVSWESVEQPLFDDLRFRHEALVEDKIDLGKEAGVYWTEGLVLCVSPIPIEVALCNESNRCELY